MSESVTVAAAIARGLEAYVALTDLAEEVADEWQYITDLTASWRTTLEGIVADRGDRTVAGERMTAIETAADEIALITDPHRAIDWLSTFPQVVLLAVLAP